MARAKARPKPTSTKMSFLNLVNQRSNQRLSKGEDALSQGSVDFHEDGGDWPLVGDASATNVVEYVTN